jgi:hypothetical protein
MNAARSKATNILIILFAIMVGALIGGVIILVSFDDPNPPWSEGGLQ